MASYIRSWLTPGISPSVPMVPSIIPPQDVDDDDDDDDDNKTVKGDDDNLDEPPAFPSLNSAQRLDPVPTVPLILNDSDRMPPPPLPGLATRKPGVAPQSLSTTLAVPPSSSSLAVPLSTTKIPSKAAKRQKVALAPGHGPLDWANLKKSGADLRVRY
jgi:hypothetical protein